MKRVFDFCFSLFFLLLLSPVLLAIAVGIKSTGSGPVIFSQSRVGKNGKLFLLYKFRSMRNAPASDRLLTIGNDSRITPFGKFLRRSKLDELPQLWNVLRGEMSVVGPRPEVEKYVKLYSPEQLRILTYKPGITDPASLAYFHEGDQLAKYENPEEAYVNIFMPAKLSINLQYSNTRKWYSDYIIIMRTILRIFSSSQ